ncbi:homocysteine S-methyltransferase family protein [Actinokineospora terrae]|uniref:Homocysteine/selenocysteine methylase (S-methylmethionine-dependent) n=1 Tax=Actinokineospora terrae TaxID=155974 RepID=A0A1H9X6R0_9PSEU|nr:homocysteine S-methyltransferase family protein [Actinokineospora terrae]SES41759.1 Homocysteine/selenocysteine methylase (S-methylmethionine-dependent) [Actinokineospora terrae]
MDTHRTRADPVLLDGAVATELQRAGIPVCAPWWTTRALLAPADQRVLRGIHAAHLRAGADVVTANTFRCHDRTLRGLGTDQATVVDTAVELARAARADTDSPALIAGSLAPVADCYRPDLVPPDEVLHAEHSRLAAALARAGVDLVLVETMNTLREARIALAAALAAGVRAWVSFACGGGARLLSGEPLAAAAREVERAGAGAVLVNCSTPADTEACLPVLRETCAGPVGAYPNIEDRTGVDGPVERHLPAALPEGEFGALLARWHTEGADVLGGCCGTTPAHLSQARPLIPAEAST